MSKPEFEGASHFCRLAILKGTETIAILLLWAMILEKAPGLKPRDYRRYIKMGKEKHLLVEGPEDKRIFSLLLDELQQGRNKSEIIIDNAELIQFSSEDLAGDVPGNRQKVEAICQSIKNEPYKNKFVGFVDREFRRFKIGDIIYDELNSHRVEDRLVWSKGHSIENYFFDFLTMRRALKSSVATDYFREALELFEKILPSAICLAGTLSIVAKELQITKQLIPSINWECLMIDIDNNKVTLKINDWKEHLTTNHPKLICVGVIDKYEYWYPIVEKNDFNIVRWLCHGHIGMKIIWAVYSCCICQISHDPKEGQKLQSIKEENRTNQLASSWSERAVNNFCDYPQEVFQLFGLNQC